LKTSGKEGASRPPDLLGLERRTCVRVESEMSRRRCFFPIAIGVVVTAIAVAVLAPASRSLGQGMSSMPKKETLYQRMGGYDVIANVVDGFIGQLKTDPAFKRFGGGRSISSLIATRQLIVDQLCNLTGGPCMYIGRPMKMAHAGLGITQQEWETSMKFWKASLEKSKVGDPEQKEFLAIIENLRKDIVEKPEGKYPAAGKSMKQN
jgi:hemoglobin